MTTCFSLEEADLTNTDSDGFIPLFSQVVASSSWVSEVTMSARAFDANEALQVGFVSGILHTKEEMISQALDLADRIGNKSSNPIHMTKQMISQGRKLRTSKGNSLRVDLLSNVGHKLTEGQIHGRLQSGLLIIQGLSWRRIWTKLWVLAV